MEGDSKPYEAEGFADHSCPPSIGLLDPATVTAHVHRSPAELERRAANRKALRKANGHKY